MAASTNRLLFAIVLLLFALIFRLVSTGGEVIVFFIALAGLGFGVYGLMSTERRP